MKRMIALITALLMLTSCAWAEELEVPQFEKETVHAVVEQLFAAAAGTTQDTEKSARKGMDKAERALRNADNALYRAQTQPWLMAAFQPEAPEAVTAPEPTAAPQDASAEQIETPVYTLEDSWNALQSNPEGQAYLAMLEQQGGTDMESCLQVTRQMCQQWLAEIDHEALLEQNEDYACWIYAAGMPIDYPVVQDDNNDYYLNHLFNGNRNASGTLFIDYRNLPGFEDPNTLIYGHHMRNEGMFGMLDEYAAQEFYEAHPYMLMISAEGIDLVEIVAAYTTSSKDHCYDIAISDEEDMQSFIEQAQKKSDVETGVQVAVTDHLVTLSTCAYAFENARYIAIGRLVSVWENTETAPNN